jgi:hypothetical protein
MCILHILSVKQLNVILAYFMVIACVSGYHPCLVCSLPYPHVPPCDRLVLRTLTSAAPP